MSDVNSLDHWLRTARRDGMWFKSVWISAWFPPDELERDVLGGKLKWIPSDWVLADPKAEVNQLDAEIEERTQRRVKLQRRIEEVASKPAEPAIDIPATQMSLTSVYSEQANMVESMIVISLDIPPNRELLFHNVSELAKLLGLSGKTSNRSDEIRNQIYTRSIWFRPTQEGK